MDGFEHVPGSIEMHNGIQIVRTEALPSSEPPQQKNSSLPLDSRLDSSLSAHMIVSSNRPRIIADDHLAGMAHDGSGDSGQRSADADRLSRQMHASSGNTLAEVLRTLGIKLTQEASSIG